MWTFCQEVAGAVEGLADDSGTFGGIGFSFWAAALSTKPFIANATIMKSKSFILFISALLWLALLNLVLALLFP
jgi:hypothetical protein